MGKSNKKAKEELIKLYGAECFIDKLHIRTDSDRVYTGKGQYKKMTKARKHRLQELTYHHILEKSKRWESYC